MFRLERIAAVAIATVFAACGGGNGANLISNAGTDRHTLSGTPAASLQPTNLTFFAAIGRLSTTQLVTLRNAGTATLTISSIQTKAPFFKSTTCGTALAPAANCSIGVKFYAGTAATAYGTLYVYDNATGSPQKVALTGRGVCTKAGYQCAASLPPCCPGLRCVPFSVRAFCEPSTATTSYRAVGANTDTVLVVDRVKNVLIRAVQVGAGARSLAITPDGSKIYVANESAHAISVMDTKRNTVVKIIDLGIRTRPADVAFASNGLVAYATDKDAGTVSVIDATSDAVAATMPAGILPTKIATLPRCSLGIVGSADGSIVYQLGSMSTHADTAASDEPVAFFDTQTDWSEEQ